MAKKKKVLAFNEPREFDEVFDPDIPWTGYVRRDWIVPNPKQPRKEFDPEDLVELRDSIEGVGQQRAISVIPHKEEHQPNVRFMIHDGERGWRAIEMMGDDVPILVLYNPEIDQERLHLQSFAANFGRKGHTHCETIQAVWHELEELGTSVEELATAVCRTPAWVYQYKSLHDLHPDLQAKLDARATRERLTMNTALMIARLEHPQQLEIYARIKGLPAKQATALVRNIKREIEAGKTATLNGNGSVQTGKSNGSRVARFPGATTRSTGNRMSRNDRRRLLTFLENAAVELADFNSVGDDVYTNMDPATVSRVLTYIQEIAVGLSKVKKRTGGLAPKSDGSASKVRSVHSDLAQATEIARKMFRPGAQRAVGVDDFVGDSSKSATTY